MSAFFVATVTVKDADKFQEYAQKAGASMKPFDGVLLERGQARKVLAGSADQHNVGIVRFPTLADLTEWYQSKAYQEIIPLRDQASDMTIVAYEASS